MKACTDLEQSQKLADILPIESADMWWNIYSVTTDNTTPQIIHLDTPWVDNFNWDNKPDNVPCWSLDALLDALPEINGIPLTLEKVKAKDGYEGYYYHIEYENMVLIPYSKNPIDACYEMILKLHELNLL